MSAERNTCLDGVPKVSLRRVCLPCLPDGLWERPVVADPSPSGGSAGEVLWLDAALSVALRLARLLDRLDRLAGSVV